MHWKTKSRSLIPNGTMSWYAAVVLAMLLASDSPVNAGSVVDTASAYGFAEQFPDRVIPLWALVKPGDNLATSLSTETFPELDSTSCPVMTSIQLQHDRFDVRFDSVRQVTELYVAGGNHEVARFDIAADLSHDSVILPVDSGGVWIANDLDKDGNVDIVTQWSDELRFFSAPDWSMRQKIVFPGYNVTMYPTTLNLDADPYLEIFTTPNTLGGTGRAVMIKYDPVSDTFKVISDIVAPDGTRGHPAIGDFDEDGRMEFISGVTVAGPLGYGLFEWQDSTLVYIGQVGGAWSGNDFYASSGRPKPDGKLYAILGHAGIGGRWYDLLLATGDNTFVIDYVFNTGLQTSGTHPNFAADVDCDGLDEVFVRFSPNQSFWDWNVEANDFVEGCGWNKDVYGTFTAFEAVDLDQDGSPEWATVAHTDIFYALPDTACTACLDNICHAPSWPCDCLCFGDPECNQVPNVFDVVAAVDIAFRSGSDISDPLIQCPKMTTDVTCDDLTDVFDVVAIVDVAFRSADPAVAFCDPCP